MELTAAAVRQARRVRKVIPTPCGLVLAQDQIGSQRVCSLPKTKSVTETMVEILTLMTSNRLGPSDLTAARYAFRNAISAAFMAINRSGPKSTHQS
jgi:hypothetical protein